MKADPGFPEMIAKDTLPDLLYRAGTLKGYCDALRMMLGKRPNRTALAQDLAETEANAAAIIAEWKARRGPEWLHDEWGDELYTIRADREYE